MKTLTKLFAVLLLLFSISTASALDVYTINPTVNDDNTKHYRVGNQWLNSSTHITYTCVDVTTGAAVWVASPLGPSSSTDNAIVRYDGITGKLVQDSAVTIADTTGAMSVNGAVTIYRPYIDAGCPYETVIFGDSGSYLQHDTGQDACYNTFLGEEAGYSTTTGHHNTLAGSDTAFHLTTGNYNSIYGSDSLGAATSASGNSILGFISGGVITTGSENTLIGHYVGSNITSGSNNIVIGYNLTVPSATADNQLNIGNSILGNLSTHVIDFPGSIRLLETGSSHQYYTTIQSGDLIGAGIILTTPNSVGSSGQVLQSDGTKMGWTTATYPVTAGTSGNILKSDGTNWTSSATLGVTSITDSVKWLHTGNAYAGLFDTSAVASSDKSYAFPNRNLNVAGTSGSLTSGNFAKFDSSGNLVDSGIANVGNLPWTEVTGTTQMAVNNGYIANNASKVVFTLPATAAQGSIVEVAGKGAGGWSINANTGQTIYYGASSQTYGIQSTNVNDSIRLLTTTANTRFTVLSNYGTIVQSLWNGVQGKWKLANTTYTDSSPNGNTLTALNTPTATTGHGGGSNLATHFAGASAQDLYITDANQVGLDITGNFTATGWIYLDSVASYNNSIFKKLSSPAGHYSYDSYVNHATSKIEFRLSNDGTSLFYCIGATTISAGKWYFVAMTYDGSYQRIYLYCSSGCPNGVDTNGASNPMAYSGGIYNSDSDFRISAGAFDGRLDDITIWNRALSASEIATMYGGEDDFSGL